jgi:AcrR family transcriptional regulator
MSKPPRSTRTDGEATRTRILEAAGGLFAASGYAETTSKAIAAQAEVDVASINYHFGSRSGLYQAVLVEAHRRLISLMDLRELVGTDIPAAAKLEKLFEHLVERSAEDRSWNIRVLARELLAPSSHLEVLFQQEVLPKFLVVRQLLSDVTGIPADDPALIRCLVSVAAPCAMLLVIGRSVPGPLRDVLQMPAASLSRHLQTFAMAGLEAVSRDYKNEHAGKPRVRRT